MLVFTMGSPLTKIIAFPMATRAGAEPTCQVEWQETFALNVSFFPIVLC